MLREPIYSFHDVKMSLAQSAMREIVSKSSDPGTQADHPHMQMLGRIFERVTTSSYTTFEQVKTLVEVYAQELLGRVGRSEKVDCMNLLTQLLVAHGTGDRDKVVEIESEFRDSPCDPGWCVAVATFFENYYRNQKPMYIEASVDTIPFALPEGNIKVGLLADWGSGEPEAEAVLDQLMHHRPDVIIHLGDIYYAGTYSECKANFLNPINFYRSKYDLQIPVYAVPGNHDYYSGGKGFYEMLKELNAPIASGEIQNNSFFCLRNRGWQLEGLDTGYNDHDLLKVSNDFTHLEESEVAWHQKQLSEAGSRKIILLSHHQLFSAFTTIGSQSINKSLLANLKAWEAVGISTPVLWLWGHEHLLEIYDKPSDTGLPVLGRCIGNGALPVFANQSSYNSIPGVRVPLQISPSMKKGYIQTGTNNLVYNNGYALLTLGESTGTAEYYEVVFNGQMSTASSQCLWTDRL